MDLKLQNSKHKCCTAKYEAIHVSMFVIGLMSCLGTKAPKSSMEANRISVDSTEQLGQLRAEFEAEFGGSSFTLRVQVPKE